MTATVAAGPVPGRFHARTGEGGYPFPGERSRGHVRNVHARGNQDPHQAVQLPIEVLRLEVVGLALVGLHVVPFDVGEPFALGAQGSSGIEGAPPRARPGP